MSLRIGKLSAHVAVGHSLVALGWLTIACVVYGLQMNADRHTFEKAFTETALNLRHNFSR